MKKLMVILCCVLLACMQIGLAETVYEYPTMDFYQQEIPQPRPEYIPDGTPIIDMLKYLGASNFDATAFINSTYGELSSQWLLTTYSGYTSGMDEALLDYWAEKGVNKEGFGLENDAIEDDYYVYTPADMDEDSLYPLLIVSHGGGSDCFSVEGMGFINMIPEEQFILATAEDTSVESLYAMYEYVIANYPVDIARVYATGTSMGGMASINFAAAYPQLVAAIAPNDISLAVDLTDEQLANLQETLVPMNFTAGLADMYHPFPVTDIDGYNRLLSVFGLDDYAMTAEESQALVADSLDIVEHATGLRLPNVQVVNYTNNRLYVSDFENEEGVTVLRINVVENKPHMFVGMDAQNAWNFMKQYSRNTETGELNVLAE